MKEFFVGIAVWLTISFVVVAIVAIGSAIITGIIMWCEGLVKRFKRNRIN